MDLKDARILISGGSSGLGKEMAKVLSEAGANVLITGRDEEKVEAVAQELGVSGISADASSEADILRTFEAVKSELGGLDVLINNAGFGEFALIEDLTLKAFQSVFGTNVFGAALMGREAAKIFKAQNHGNIINISSTAGRKGFAHGSVYASSKFALSGLTECWRDELRKHNVRVMQVNPSAVPTAFNVEDRSEKELEDNKLTPTEIAHAIKSMLEMDSRGFIPELAVWATNPF
ncbi:MAG: 3-oxoacyl-[acyl-carrier protein] reductase [Bacteroidia bacterium]|jgi:3-oxoacyl-[acyl-carrier protein] reductase